MKIKTKLRLGFAFLFIVVIFFGATALYYIQVISASAKVILKDNYETLNYTKNMRALLDENAAPFEKNVLQQFNRELAKQEKNITEAGEKEATLQVREAFDQLSSESPSSPQLLKAIRANLRTIETLNMNAIVRKNAAAMSSVKKATLYLSMAGTFAFLVLLSFSVNFPGFIAGPLKLLQDGIREIGEKNYSQRLNFDKDDEFGDVAAAFNQMAERLNEWENSNLAGLKSEKLRIETIIEQMQDAIIGLNEQDQILFINQAAETIFNLQKAEVTGQPIHLLTKRNDLLKSIISTENILKPLKIYANEKESFFKVESREINIPNLQANKDNALRQASVSAGKVIILRNITEFKERDEAKSNFIATISHELKTPMSSIKMSLQLLNDERIGELNSEQQGLVANIKSDCDRLLRISSELLDLSQVETGNLKLNISAIDPLKILDYAIDTVKFQAEQKEVKLEVQAAAGLPQVHADTDKTAWVLVNLLSNALRYSHEKSRIIISVKAEASKLIFSVRDFGKGIDEQYQKRLFERYFRIPADGSSKSGTGLGLAISKEFIEAQNGQIWVESAIGEGSSFSFALPVG